MKKRILLPFPMGLVQKLNVIVKLEFEFLRHKSNLTMSNLAQSAHARVCVCVHSSHILMRAQSSVLATTSWGFSLLSWFVWYQCIFWKCFISEAEKFWFFFSTAQRNQKVMVYPISHNSKRTPFFFPVIKSNKVSKQTKISRAIKTIYLNTPGVPNILIEVWLLDWKSSAGRLPAVPKNFFFFWSYRGKATRLIWFSIISRTIVGGVFLTLCRGAVGIFYSPHLLQLNGLTKESLLSIFVYLHTHTHTQAKHYLLLCISHLINMWHLSFLLSLFI